VGWQPVSASVCALIMGRAGQSKCRMCALSCRMFADVLKTEPIVYEHTLCELPFDTNGVLYHIGTQGRTQPYMNPHESGEVLATLSSSYTADVSYSCPERFVANVEPPRHNFTGGAAANQWMSVDLGASRSLLLQHYCLRHGHDNSFLLRNWMLQGSWDGLQWHTLRLHEADQTLPASRFSVASWPVDAGGRRFRMFRVLQHGPNSNAKPEHQNHLMCAGIELYGELSDLNGVCKSPRV